ncbi:SulP family inorganic anion transporter [Reyranella sp.]|uniref:SulP family inorganic anion transporter n=1 Tax=Reyranella sp. TaxID=1929291 RepID=UPI003BA9FFFF
MKRFDALNRWTPDRRNLASDLVAGLTFAVVNVPQAMAHALLASVNPILGINALMVAVPVGALFTSSVFMNVSTTAALAVAVGAALEDIPAGQRTEALAMLVLMAGAIQLLAGLLRLGSLLRFVSNAVMVGFLNGVAMLIILGQLGHLTGYDSSLSNRVAQALELLLRINQVELPTTLLGGATLALIVMLLLSPWRRYAFIGAIAGATAGLAMLTIPSLTTASYFAAVPTVGDITGIERSLPELALPPLSLLLSMSLPAVSVAIIGLIQGAGVSEGTPNPDGRYPDVSRDFLGQGAANIATSLVAGIPAGGSISGTALILGAGARSRWTNISVGFFVAAIVLLVAPLVERVPMPALAALLIVAGFQGLRLRQAVMAWKTGRIPTVVMIVTFCATLILPLHFAVLFGVALSVVLHVFRQANKVVVVQWVLQPGGFPLEQAAPPRLASRQLTLLHVYGSLFFAAAKNVEEMLPAIGDARRAVVAIVLRGKNEVGSTFVTVLERYAAALHAHDSKLMLIGVDPSVLAQLARTGVLKAIGEDNVYLATPQIGEALNRAIADATAWIGLPKAANSAGDQAS